MKSASAVNSRSRVASIRTVFQWVAGMLALLLLSLPVWSQGSFGRILGTVTDQSGGVVTGATISVIDTERGITQTLVTDDAGAYNAPNLTGMQSIAFDSIRFKVGND